MLKFIYIYILTGITHALNLYPKLKYIYAFKNRISKVTVYANDHYETTVDYNVI